MLQTLLSAHFHLAAAVAALSVALGARVGAQTPDSLRGRIAAYTRSHDVAIVRELTDFVAIPNLATDTVNIRRNAEHLVRMLSSPRHRGPLARVAERGPAGGVRRARHAWRHEDDRLLCSLRRPAGRHHTMGDAALEVQSCETSRSNPANGSVISLPRPLAWSTASGGCTGARRATTRPQSSRCWRRSMRSARRARPRR